MPVPKVDPGVLHLEHELRKELSATCPDVNPWHASSQGREEARQRVKGVEKDSQVLRQETNSETKGTDTAVPPNGTRGNKFRERHNYVSQAKKLAMRLSPILARLNALEAHLVQSTEEDGLLASSRGTGRATVLTRSNFDEAVRAQARV